jgi:hypothetical protein
MKQVKDIQPGETFYTTENIGDDRNSMEVRETFYVRDPDRPCRYTVNVPVGLIAVVQGDPNGDGPPRYVRSGCGVSRDPGEMDGRTKAYLLSDRPAVWEQSI